MPTKRSSNQTEKVADDTVATPIVFEKGYVRGGAPGLSDEQVSVLARPLNRNRVMSRREGGSNLSYLAAWDVKATLVKVFGFAGFSAEVLESKILHVGEKAQSRDPSKVNAVVVAQATVRLTIHATGAVYTETATGQNSQPDIGKAMDTAFKSAESDALKRAAIYLGTQFGLSLYGGTQNDVCRPVLEPTQKAAIEAAQAQQHSPETQSALDRVTGNDIPAVAEDAAAEDAAIADDDSNDESQEAR